MSDAKRHQVGTVAWTDLTVERAEEVRDFYAAVTGWRPEPVDMGGYEDFNMVSPATGQPAAGICHKRGVNESLPSQWLLYVVVEDVETSATRCAELRGKVLVSPKGFSEAGRYCVIQDPAGAVIALFEKKD